MRRLAVPAAMVAAAVALGACGGATTHHPGDANGLRWVGRPTVVAPRTLPRDRVAIGQIRNVSGATLRIDASRVVVRDARGHRLVSTAQFAAGYAHGLYGAYQKPGYMPSRELLRLGKIVILKAGRTAPLSVSWHLPPGVRTPLRVDLGRGELTLPAGARRGARGV